MNVCFYSHFGNGDLFNSREIIKYIIKNNDNKYTYAHNKAKRIFEDIDNLSYSKIYPFMHGMTDVITGNYDDIYINTWIGRDSKYVLPGIGCTIDMYIKMFNNMLTKVECIDGIPTDGYKFIPTIDYNKLMYKKNIDNFLSKIDVNRSVFVSNGSVHSGQAKNFLFEPILDKITNKYKDVKFFLTQKENLIRDNIFYTYNITKPEDSFDLNELSYLSTFIPIIIGRSSGPYVFTQVKENIENPDKIFLSFTYHKNSTDLLLNYDKKCENIWSSHTNYEDVINKIDEVLCKHL